MKEKFLVVCKLLSDRCLFIFAFFVFSSNYSFAFERTHEDFKQDSIRFYKFTKEGRQALIIGDFEKAVSDFDKAFRVGREIFGTKSTKLFSPLTNRGIAYKSLGEYDKAIESYLRGEKILSESYSINDPRLGFIYTNLGIVYKLKGDYVKNYEYQRAAVRCFNSDVNRYGHSASQARYNETEALFLLKDYQEAIINCKENILISNNNVKSFYYSLLARIYKELEKPELTKKYYQETFDILKEIAGPDSYDLGLEYTNYTEFLLSIGEYKEAMKYVKLSEKIIKEYFTSKSLQYSDVMLNYADYYFQRSSEASVLSDFFSKRKNDLGKALEYYQRALIAGADGFASMDITSDPELGQEISEIQLLEVLRKKTQCLVALADLNLSTSNHEEAIANYSLAMSSIERATELIHQIRTGYVSEDSQFFLAENQESTFVEAVSICYKLYRQTNDFYFAEKGFEFAEKSKSASFLAAVKDSRAKKFGGIPDSFLKREDYLKMNISNYKEMLFEENQNSEPDSARIELFNSKIFQLSEQYEQLVQVFEDSFPNYYSFKYQNNVVSVKDIQDRINRKTAVLEYLIEEPTKYKLNGQVFKFVITGDNIHFTREVVDSAFVKNIESVYQFLTSSKYLFTGLEEYNTYGNSAFQLYDVLIKNDRPMIEDKELVVIPDDKLAYLPFDALLSQRPDTTKMNFRTLPYLVKDFSISYTYSATLLYNYFEKKKTAAKDLLAFAPSYEGDERDYTITAEFRGGLLPLPAVKKEVEFINEYVKGDVFKDSLAQETQFKNLAADYDILHLAMHTIINDTLPMYSKLAFSKPYSGQNDDGWLNTSEIYTMDLNARMAVLSACNTGSGKLQKGEGVMSLARGFLYAGCPSIVMTLWEVEDESGAHIMKDFYRFLSNGKNKTQALRAAKLAHIEKADPLKAHPHYWLGYVVVGNSDPLYGGNDIYFVLIILGVIIFLLTDQIHRKRKARP